MTHPQADAESRRRDLQRRPNGISGVAADNRTRMLNEPLPPRRYVWRIDRARMTGVLDIPASASKRIELPLASDARPRGGGPGG